MVVQVMSSIVCRNSSLMPRMILIVKCFVRSSLSFYCCICNRYYFVLLWLCMWSWVCIYERVNRIEISNSDELKRRINSELAVLNFWVTQLSNVGLWSQHLSAYFRPGGGHFEHLLTVNMIVMWYVCLLRETITASRFVAIQLIDQIQAYT